MMSVDVPEAQIGRSARLLGALAFAAERHCDQRRKGARAEPYINHLIEVAELVASAVGDDDGDCVIAAVLHDILEDTDTTRAELAGRFGERVASLVGEVSDDKSLPKATRKRLQVAHAAHASPGAKLIKLADKISNLRSLATSPPADWDAARITEYVDWAGEVVDQTRGVAPSLERLFDEATGKFAAKR